MKYKPENGEILENVGADVTSHLLRQDQSGNPMAWQRAADALHALCLFDISGVCHSVARELFRNANANDKGVE